MITSRMRLGLQLRIRVLSARHRSVVSWWHWQPVQACMTPASKSAGPFRLLSQGLGCGGICGSRLEHIRMRRDLIRSMTDRKTLRNRSVKSCRRLVGRLLVWRKIGLTRVGSGSNCPGMGLSVTSPISSAGSTVR